MKKISKGQVTGYIGNMGGNAKGYLPSQALLVIFGGLSLYLLSS